MTSIDVDAPIVVGAVQVVNRPGPTFHEQSATALMTDACRRALDQTGARDRLVSLVGEILVPHGTWPESDPGRAIAAAIGAPGATSVRSELGVSQHTLLRRAATVVAAGRTTVALVVGGENRWSEIEAVKRGVAAPEPPNLAIATEPDEVLESATLPIGQIEIDRNLTTPAHQYAIIESAYRHHLGRSPADHQQHLGALWERMARVAAGADAAWHRQGMSAAQILDTSSSNRVIADPYRKWMVSQWNVDQAAALVVTTVRTARELRIPEGLWVHPLAIAISDHVVPMSERRELHRWPAAAVAATAAFDAADLEPSAVSAVDLYSCFPVAVEVQAAEIGISLERDVTVTGGMTFAGGPYNNYSLQGAAAMVDVLRRSGSGAVGLTTAVSGFLTKPSVALWATSPPSTPFAALDVTAAAAAATDRSPVDPEYVGDATVVGATVVPGLDQASELLAVVESSGGVRTVATSGDRGLVDRGPTEGVVGALVTVTEPGRFRAR